MWGANKRQRSEKVDTLIGQQTELHGDVMFSGGLHVDGRVKGNIIAEKESSTMLVLSEKGSIEGEIRVPYIIVNGLVVGDIYASESVELAQNARITGNVYYNRIEIAMGAEVNGSLVHYEEKKDSHVAADVSELKLRREADGGT
jgi:cytoskeletal protein CcmA (bactofilin family)